MVKTELIWTSMKYAVTAGNASFLSLRLRHLRLLRHMRRSLSTQSATTLVHAFVTSRIDYCNVVFFGAPKSVTNKLQRGSPSGQ